MNKIRLILFVFIIPLYLFSAGNHFYDMSNREIDSLLTEISKKSLTVTQKMDYFSAYFLGTPYDFKCIGDGINALMENYPLLNFKETNCMALCEHVLALAISDGWDNFFNNLMHIRYKNGLIGMKTRNHYTMADWLPQNSWILDDVSAKIGGNFTKKMTRTISHRQFFSAKGITDMRYVLDDRTMTIDYVPLQDLHKVGDKINQGDILTLLFANKDNIFAAHMVMIVVKNSGKYVREATTRGMTTIDTPYQEWIKNKQEKSANRYAGIAFMRVKKSLNLPGKIIYPGDVCKMKIN